jgi:hypothetical protein
MKQTAFAIMIALATVIDVVMAPGAIARPLGHEAQAVIDTLLAPPAIKPEPRVHSKDADTARRALRPAVHGAARHGDLDE